MIVRMWEVVKAADDAPKFAGLNVLVGPMVVQNYKDSKRRRTEILVVAGSRVSGESVPIDYFIVFVVICE